MPAHRYGHGVADEIIIAIGRSGCAGRVAHRSRRSPTEFVCDIEVKFFALVADTGAEKMPVQIGNGRSVICVRHGIFAESVTGADVPAVVEITCRAPFKKPA